MTITRTPIGTAPDKTGADTLTIPSVTVAERAMLLVGIVWDAGMGDPTLTWGQHELETTHTRAGGGIACRIGTYVRHKDEESRPLTATWSSSAPIAKAMFATQVEGATIVDVVESSEHLASADPSSGSGTMTQVDEEIIFGVFASEGPESDDAGTLSGGLSSGQRVGTAGAPPVSNVTIHEAFRTVSAKENASASKTGATSRDWCTIMVSVRAATDLNQGITQTDIEAMRRIFNDATPQLPLREGSFRYNQGTDEWELWDVIGMPNTITGGTLIAKRRWPGSRWIEE